MNSIWLSSIVLLLVACTPAGAAQNAAPQPATPTDPIAAIVEAFRTHNIVTLTDPHGNGRFRTSFCRLVRDPASRKW